MYQSFLKQFGTIVAFGVLAFFFTAIALHPFVVHHHDDFTTDPNPFLLIHVGVSKHAAGYIVMPVFLLVLTLMQFFQVSLGHALGQRGLQGLDIPIILSLRRALRVGVMNAMLH